MAVKMLMKGAVLPGNSTVELKDFEIPVPGHGQVLIQTKATTICGSDIRCIYREHTGKGPEGYIPGMVAGHEPCGIIVEEGEGLKRVKKGDRVIVYHISGCGVCNDGRRGYYISCKSRFRQAYGWQRKGGMAPYILAEENDLIALPDELSYKDGAQVACGFGSVYEAIEKIGICGNDAVLVTGLGPVGLAALMLAKALGANKLIGVEMNDYRIDLAKKLGLAYQIIDDILDMTADEKLLGKPVHSDEEQNKSTYPAIFGLEAAKEKAAELTDRAMAAIEKLPDNGFITELTVSLLKRQY